MEATGRALWRALGGHWEGTAKSWGKPPGGYWEATVQILHSASAMVSPDDTICRAGMRLLRSELWGTPVNIITCMFSMIFQSILFVFMALACAAIVRTCNTRMTCTIAPHFLAHLKVCTCHNALA